VPLSKDQLLQLLRKRPGLLLGPAQTLYPGAIHDFLRSLGVAQSEIPIAGTLSSDAPARLRTFAANVRAGMGTTELASVRWASVLSLCPDTFFDEEFRNQQDKRATRTSAVFLDPPNMAPPPKSLPVFRLLGSTASDSYTLSRSQYARAKGAWPKAVRAFVDSLKGAPLVCIGLQDSLTSLLDLISMFMGLPQGAPPNWIFLGSDPLGNSKELSEALYGVATVSTTDMTIGQLTRAIDSTRIVTARPQITNTEQWPFISLLRFSHAATLINGFVAGALPYPTHTSTTRLLDILFSPSSADWEPFRANLDFSRSTTQTIVADCTALLRSGDSRCIVVTGGAATGKTTILKRIGFELAKEGHLALWLRAPFGADSHVVFRDLIDHIAEVRPTKTTSVAIFTDDALSFGAGALRAIVLQAEQHSLPLLLISSCRHSEWQTHETSAVTGGLPLEGKYPLEDDLDEAELGTLPEYLRRIQVATDLQHAKTLVAQATSRHARDILGLLYLLLPSTRGTIRISIQDEYFRLGDMSYVATRLLELATTSSQILKHAYELVAVSCYHRTPVPVEVLVSALGVPYSKWLEETKTHGAAWGVLYSADVDEEEETERYCTRNSVVNEVIVGMVNGSSISTAGEALRLREAVSACTGSQQTYRDYCVHLLVNNGSLERLKYEEGLDLFSAAQAALPFPDKTLQHHKGLWIKNHGGRAVDALRELEIALKTPNFPNVPKPEHDEHVYTSMAAAKLAAIKQGESPISEGTQDIIRYLDQASSPRFLNPNAIHVRANTILQLLDRVAPDNKLDVMTLSNHALSALEVMIAAFDVGDESPVRRADVEMLRDVRGRLFGRLKSANELIDWAQEAWQTRNSQEGFALVARRMLDAARTASKGPLFREAHDYCDEAVRTVEKAGGTPSAELIRISMYTLYEWRVRRPAGSELSHVWTDLESLFVRYLRVAAHVEDAQSWYIGAITLCHLGRWAEARSYFSRLRALRLPNHVKFAERDKYMNTNGTIRKLAGTLKRGGSENFFQCPELPDDFHLSRGDNWPSTGAAVNAWLAFAYAGPTAHRD
jgi:hypothetical protein